MGQAGAGTKWGITVNSTIALMALAASAVGLMARCASATIVYSDSFDRSALNGGTYAYSTTVTAGDGDATLVGNQLRLTNDATTAANAKGIVYVSTPTSAFDTAFNPTLSNNDHLLSWTMNFRQSNSAPGGMAAGQFGVACVLGASSSSFASTGSGYAVLIGNGGTLDPVRLVPFSNGLAALGSGVIDSSVYMVSGWSNQPTHYYSAKVTFDPANSNWTLYTRDDGTSGFADPTDPTGYVNNGSDIDATATDVPLTCLGAYWSYNTATAQSALFDNFSLEVADDAITPEPASAATLAIIAAAMAMGSRRR